jgi:hypothetical protein
VRERNAILWLCPSDRSGGRTAGFTMRPPRAEEGDAEISMALRRAIDEPLQV